MISFHPLTSDNFDHFAHDILLSEEMFPENIRETREGYLEALNQHRCIGLVATVGGIYAGNVIGFCPSGPLFTELRLHEIYDACDELLYLFNISAVPEFQNQGMGKRLLNTFLSHGRMAGFSKVGGHFRGNGSLKNFMQRGGTVMALFDNWFDTEETYTYCELCLNSDAEGIWECAPFPENAAVLAAG